MLSLNTAEGKFESNDITTHVLSEHYHDALNIFRMKHIVPKNIHILYLRTVFVLQSESHSRRVACGTIKSHSMRRGVPPPTLLITFHIRLFTNRPKMIPVSDESHISGIFFVQCKRFFSIVGQFLLKAVKHEYTNLRITQY